MSKRFSKTDICLLWCFVLVFFTSPAVISAQDAAKRIKGPITITSGMLTADSQAHTALFEHNVIARTADMTMYADSMLVHYDQETGNVTRIDVHGAVKVTTANRVITSREAIYYAGEEKIVFSGEPRAVDGANVVTGEKMTYLMKNERFLVESSKVFLTNTKE